MGAGRSRIAVALATGVIAAGIPAPSVAEDFGVQRLPGTTVSALTIDLDGNGSAEVVRLLDSPGSGFNLEAWDVDDDGRWALQAAVALPIDADAGNSDPRDEVASLVSVTVSGRDELLAVTARADRRATFGGNCCLRIQHISRDGPGLAVTTMPIEAALVQQLSTLDLDGDGTDELVLAASPDEAGLQRLAIYSWSGADWVPVDEFEIPGFGGWTMVSGVEGGHDAVLVGPDPRGDVSRISLIGGELLVEAEHIDLGESFDGWLAASAGDRLVLVSSDGVRVVEWPSSGSPTVVARYATSSYPAIQVLGAGPDMLLLAMEQGFRPSPGPPLVTILDAELDPLGQVEPNRSITGVWEVLRPDLNFGDFQRNIFPHFGPLPGLIDGRHAAVASGVLVQPIGAGKFEEREVSSFVGMQPVGRAGPGDAWLAMGDGFFGTGDPVFLFPFDAIRADAGRLVIGSIEALLDPAPPLLTVGMVGGVEVARSDDELEVLASSDGMSIEISAPEGSLVISTQDNRLRGDVIVGSEPMLVDISPPRARDAAADLPFERWLAVIAPDGRSRSLHVQGTFVLTNPTLRAAAATAAFSLRSTIRGRVSSWVEVEIDGVPVPVTADGRFVGEVDAPIWPRDVTITARHRLGNETVTRLQVVGFLDYRGLPWAAIVGAAILAAGAFLFVRTPRPRQPRTLAAGEGTLEEVDPD